MINFAFTLFFVHSAVKGYGGGFKNTSSVNNKFSTFYDQ